ncbi:MAG: hypothetical protein Q4G50_09055 [Corynebacterium sp.]|uniref:hypothetical protein n=1 Tax=Corynebacterium sp. TaxID=1720 RepID=UPI0026DF7FEC|nr:hypothetical protein [Corynebacterium sp.]MDO5670138.1 hypothetical protein [Corynebacterium sp.]
MKLRKSVLIAATATLIATGSAVPAANAITMTTDSQNCTFVHDPADLNTSASISLRWVNETVSRAKAQQRLNNIQSVDRALEAELGRLSPSNTQRRGKILRHLSYSKNHVQPASRACIEGRGYQSGGDPAAVLLGLSSMSSF